MRDHNGFNRRRFDLVIGHRLFTDGAERAVHLSAEGGQYVLDEAGMPVNGVWLLLPKRNCLDRDERRLPIRFWLWEPITEFLERIAAKDRPQVRMHIAVFH